jgi:hypothetical protein
MATGFNYSRFNLVPPPPGGFWRVSDRDAPFEPRPAPPSLDETDNPDDDSGRWDAPDGTFRTL